MPHSSGGGSFGGGSHGGSHSSGGSHGSSGGTYVPHHVIRRSYFAGSHRYVYYRHRRAYYYYSDLTPAEYGKSRANLKLFAIVAVIFLAVSVLLLFSAHKTPQKLNGAVSGITITDNANVIDNKEELKQTLSAFADKTGVMPAVVTCNNSDWKNVCANLEIYAYNLYVSMFNDEYHWLIVYSTDGTSTGWYWEGMQGDNTDSVLHTEITDKFNDKMHRAFLKNQSVGKSLNDTFQEFLPQMLEPYWVPELVLFGGVFLVVTVAMIAYIIYSFRQSKAFASAEPIPLRATELSCEYCGGKFVHGESGRCPHCGAPEK